MKKNSKYFFIIIVFSILLIIELVGAVTVSGIPGLTGFSSVSSSLSSSSISSSSITGISSSTHITTSSQTTTAPTQSPVSSGLSPLTMGLLSQPLTQWQPSSEGYYFDPYTNSTWLYDMVLRKFFSPTHGWFVINELLPDPITGGYSLVDQYYYDPMTGLFLDKMTGLPLRSGQVPTIDGTSAQPELPSGTSVMSPVVSPTVTSSISISSGSTGVNTGDSDGDSIPMSPGPEQGGMVGGLSEESQEDIQYYRDDSCLVECPDCPTGYCNDCDMDGYCDEDLMF